MKSLIALALAAAALATTAQVSAAPAHDEILLLGFEQFATAPLPAGPAVPGQYPYPGVAELTVLPSGMVVGVAFTSYPEHRIALDEVLPNGALRRIGLIAEPPYAYSEEILRDLAVDHRGRLYLLVETRGTATGTKNRLVEIDPVTAATLGSKDVILGLTSITTAPEGLWAYDGTFLYPLDPDTGIVSAPRVEVRVYVNVTDIAADSAGKVWLLAAPVCETLGDDACLYTLDPETGAVQRASDALSETFDFLYDIAIRRRCIESSTVRCLSGGRFRAEIQFSDYAGVAGVARSAPARSSDTGVFSFFDEDNWELMVKVLDGCGINSRFWVYGAASTDVAYTLTVTDTETGARKVYGNPLGQVAVTITDNQAFACSPADLAASEARARAPQPLAIAQPLAGTPAAPAPSAGSALRHDELLFYQQPQGIRRVTLPAGPTGPATPAPAVYALQALPDGRVLAASDGGEGTVMLSELRDDGSLANIARIGFPGNPPLTIGGIADMAIAGNGSLWLLTTGDSSGGSSRALILINYENGYFAFLRVVSGEITAIAGSPRGLWAAAGHRLYEIAPTGFFWIHEPDVLLPGWMAIDSLDVDSAGRVYFAGHRPSCAPNCTSIGVYDPRTGGVAEAPAGFPEGPVAELAIRRRCVDSPTSRCLQEGRFRAEIRYEGYDGAAGDAQAAPARSAATGIFSFFDPANWEQMVKVLDGCSYNGHFWVYAAASTDVAFELKVTDIETGRQKVYSNPLGQVARTITDNLAFPCGRNE